MFLRRVLIFSLAAMLMMSMSVGVGAQQPPQTQPVPPQQGTLKLPPYKRIALKNGMTLLLMEQHEVPMVSFNFIVKTGSVADPRGREGLASLTAELLRKGTRTRTADQISAELDFIGGVLKADAGYDFTSGAAEFVKKDLGKGLELLSDVLLNPTFPKEEVTKLQAQSIDAVKAAKDDASEVIAEYYNAYLYGAHPYGRPVSGDEKSLAAITQADIQKFYQTYYTPSNTILAVVGDFQLPEMERMLTERFGAWADRRVPAVQLPEVAAAKGKRLLLVDKPDSTQTFYYIGNVGVARTSADRVGINVVNTLFGGRFTSMLNSELRIKTGLTYGARSTFDQRKGRGPFMISTFTQNATTEKAIDMTLDVIKRLHERGITEEELKSAKSYLKGQFPPRIETSDQLAATIAQLEFFGLDASDINNYYARIDAMTLEDARRIILEYFPAENLVFVLIGKAEEIQAVAKKYAAEFNTKSISETGF